MRVRKEQLARELLDLEGQIHTGAATVERLRFSIEQRQIRAPIDGRVGQLSEIHPGEHVQAGDRLAAVVPNGQVKVVAYFPTSAALGRIRKGQSAQLRLDGFPWTQYGSLPAEVVELADEQLGQSVRVELRVAARADSRLPIHHGLPGVAVIEIERVTPAVLVMRAAGQWLSGVPAVR